MNIWCGNLCLRDRDVLHASGAQRILGSDPPRHLLLYSGHLAPAPPPPPFPPHVLQAARQPPQRCQEGLSRGFGAVGDGEGGGTGEEFHRRGEVVGGIFVLICMPLLFGHCDFGCQTVSTQILVFFKPCVRPGSWRRCRLSGPPYRHCCSFEFGLG
jgi:hypothetical protein